MNRKESNKTLAQWGFKDLEPVILHQTVERPKTQQSATTTKLPSPQLVPCDGWIADRFDDLHSLLSGDMKLAYRTSGFLVQLPAHPKFIEMLRGADRTRWTEMLASPYPWDLHYTMTVLNQSLQEYQKGNAERAWIVETGERIYVPLVDLLEKLSQANWAVLTDWQFCFIPCVQVLEGFINMGISSS